MCTAAQQAQRLQNWPLAPERPMGGLAGGVESHTTWCSKHGMFFFVVDGSAVLLGIGVFLEEVVRYCCISPKLRAMRAKMRAQLLLWGLLGCFKMILV